MTHRNPAARNDLASREIRLKRVLFAIALHPSDKFGSLEAQILALARAFKERGGLFLPLFISPMGPKAAADYDAGGLEAANLDLSYFNWTTLVCLIRLIRRHRIEIVHWNFYSPYNWYIWSLTFLTPAVRHYITDHGSRELPLRISTGIVKITVKKVLVRRYAKVLGISNFVRDCLRSEETWSDVSLWHYFVSTERFRPDSLESARLRKDLDAGDRFVALVVAQLIKGKGVEVAVRALVELPRNVILWIVGTGEESGPLQELCRSLSLGERVTFLGLQWDVAPYMQAADCLVCPSVWGEAVGLVILEGLSSGLPVIASKVGGIPEFIAEGKTGFLFPAGDHHSLAERIRRLQRDPEVCRRMGAEARMAVLREFSLEKRVGEYLRLYASEA